MADYDDERSCVALAELRASPCRGRAAARHHDRARASKVLREEVSPQVAST